MRPLDHSRRRAILGGLAALLAVALAAVPARAQDADAPIIAGAADLKFALEEVAGLFARETGLKVSLTFGSSGNFARQIEQGAPFELFLSADEAFVERLAATGLTRDDGKLYAIGRIVLFAPRGSPLSVDAGFDGLRTALAQGHVTRFAIANPEHAPYGRAAEQALRSQGLWDAVSSALVLGENAAQATQFASTGNAEGGIIPYSLALAPAVAQLGTYALLPAEWHAPLRQRMVLLRNAGATATAFYEFMQRPAARTVFKRYGFLLPGETS
jgi:molybdate transport system substrate-binding protein